MIKCWLLAPMKLRVLYYTVVGFPSGSAIKNLPAMQQIQVQSSWVGKIPWRRKWQPTPVFLPGKLHEQRRLSMDWATVHSIVKRRTGLSNWARTHTSSCPVFFCTCSPEDQKTQCFLESAGEYHTGPEPPSVPWLNSEKIPIFTLTQIVHKLSFSFHGEST